MMLDSKNGLEEEYDLFHSTINELIKINKIEFKNELEFNKEKLLSEVDITIENLKNDIYNLKK